MSHGDRFTLDTTTFAATGLVVATVALVIATLVYAYYTRKLVAVTDQARREQIQPIIKASLSFIGPVYVVLRCQNLGRGSAKELDVEIRFHSQSGSTSRRWKDSVLLPLGFRDFFLPGNSLEQIQANTEYVTIDGECKDALGAKTEIHDRLEVRDFLAELKTIQMRLVETTDEHLKDIAKHTGEIASVLSDIKRTLDHGQDP